ncbi:MAG: hypothetical protein OER88_10900, partial [Planctomycetota bacterium]|nr:hypothetical protein [Planctomycetota bacterium]
PADVVVKTKQAVFRTWWELRHGPATTVGAMMVQAGAAARFAGRTPVLPVAALAAANDGLAPHRDATDYPTVIAALYGDEAAATLGLPPLGLPPRAGLEVGLAEAYAG